MNSFIIQLNNRAVLEMKAGNISKAFNMLSHACTFMNSTMLPPPIKFSSCCFDWEECCASSTDVAHESLVSSSTCTKALPDFAPKIGRDELCPFLYSKCLRIFTPNADAMEVDSTSLSEFSWALWYNLAICCSLFGKLLGERGTDVLRTAFVAYERLIQNIPHSEQWSIFRIAIRNNQACAYHELVMEDDIYLALEQLALEMGRSASVHGANREAFLLNLQILGSNHVASAA